MPPTIHDMDRSEHPGPIARQMRKALGLRLQQVCELMASLDERQSGVNTGNLSKFENGKEMFSMDRLSVLAQVYRVKVGDFFPGEISGDGKVIARRYLSADARTKSIIETLLGAFDGDGVARTRRSSLAGKVKTPPAAIARTPAPGKRASKKGGA